MCQLGINYMDNLTTSCLQKEDRSLVITVCVPVTNQYKAYNNIGVFLLIVIYIACLFGFQNHV